MLAHFRCTNWNLWCVAMMIGLFEFLSHRFYSYLLTDRNLSVQSGRHSALLRLENGRWTMVLRIGYESVYFFHILRWFMLCCYDKTAQTLTLWLIWKLSPVSSRQQDQEAEYRQKRLIRHYIERNGDQYMRLTFENGESPVQMIETFLGKYFSVKHWCWLDWPFFVWRLRFSMPPPRKLRMVVK